MLAGIYKRGEYLMGCESDSHVDGAPENLIPTQCKPALSKHHRCDNKATEEPQDKRREKERESKKGRKQSKRVCGEGDTSYPSHYSK